MLDGLDASAQSEERVVDVASLLNPVAHVLSLATSLYASQIT